jgi:uncharacterized protein (DUF2147 family)
MILDAVFIYFVVSMIAIGLLVAVFFRFHFGVSDMETKLTGIWSNRDDSMRVLIYNINSQVQGEVVWTGSNDDKILGTTVIRDMRLNFFGWSKGTYIDPLTHDQFQLKLKLKNRGSLCIHIMEFNDEKYSRQQWKLVK